MLIRISLENKLYPLIRIFKSFNMEWNKFYDFSLDLSLYFSLKGQDENPKSSDILFLDNFDFSNYFFKQGVII